MAFAPHWWSQNLDPNPFGEWIGFIYGWDGKVWQRAPYDKNDGFKQVGLQRGCSVDAIAETATEAPGLNGNLPRQSDVSALIAADANITADLLEAVVPGWDIATGVLAGRKFLETKHRIL